MGMDAFHYSERPLRATSSYEKGAIQGLEVIVWPQSEGKQCKKKSSRRSSSGGPWDAHNKK